MQNYRRDIDGMRALAVLAVVLCHAGVPGFAGGFVGVDLFFVISGYLICGILARELAAGEFSLVGFYERRVRRILPPLFLVIAACFAIGWWFLTPPAYEALARSALPAALFWSNVHFRNEGAEYFAPSAEFEPLLHTWSLSVEEQFYLAVPLAMWLIWRIDRRLLLPGVLAATLTSVAWSVRMVEATPTGAFYLIQSRAWELGVGALLALGLTRWQPPRWLAEAAGLSGIGAVLFAVLAYDGTTAFPGMAALPPVFGAALLVWAGTHHATLPTRLLALPPLVGLGLVSYALYLWHWPALVLMRHLYVSVQPPALATTLAIAAALLLAVFSTWLVERPLRRRGTRAMVGRAALFALAAGAALALAGFAHWAARQEGFWQRAPGLRETVAAATARAEIEEVCRDSWREEGVPCRFGAPGAQPQVLLWGDSHAASLLPGLDLLLQDRGIAAAAVVTTGCPPLPGFRRARHGDDLDCALVNAAVLQLLDQHPEAFSEVILSARWITHVTQTNAPGEAGVHDPLVSAVTGESVPREQAPAVIEQALSALVDRITASGRRVVIVGGIPEQGSDVPALYLASRFGTLAAFEARSIGAVRQREAPADAILRRLGQRPGVTLVDPVGAICGETCPNLQDGHLLYRDGNHFSTYASQVYVPQMFEDVDW